MAPPATESQQQQQHQAPAVLPDGRKVVDEVSGWMRVLDDGSVDRTWTGPPEALPLMQPVEPYAAPRDGHTLHDIPGEPSLRVYLPEQIIKDKDSTGRLPVIVQLHGGGFCISHPSWVLYHHFYARLACALPAVVVTAELPLAPEHRLPAQIYAGVDVLRRLRAIVTSDDAAGDRKSVV